jgi:hypothetical protein
MFWEGAMREPTANPGNNPDGPKVYVGAYVPLRLHHHLVAEAEGAGISRSEMLRRVLGERYRAQQAIESKE